MANTTLAAESNVASRAQHVLQRQGTILNHIEHGMQHEGSWKGHSYLAARALHEMECKVHEMERKARTAEDRMHMQNFNYLAYDHWAATG